MKKEEPVSSSRACRVLGLARSQLYYQSKRDDSEIIGKLRELADKYPSECLGTYFKLIRRHGHHWGRMRVLRVYRLMKPGMRRKGKRRLPARVKEPLVSGHRVNEQWAMDFMSDAFSNGRRVRVLNIMDEFTREALAVYADYSIPSVGVIRQLEMLEQERGLPEVIRMDNSPVYTSQEFTDWCQSKGIRIHYIQPGRPMQNAFMERFNKIFRQDVLDAYLLDSLEELNQLAEEWMWTYNHEIPPGSLGNLTASEYARAVNSGKLPSHQSCAEFTTINSHNSSSIIKEESLVYSCPIFREGFKIIS
jgi:putative transposase